MPITNNLKKLRQERNLLQEDLANMTGTCVRTISRIECGQRNPSLEVALLISHKLDLPVEEVFQITE